MLENWSVKEVQKLLSALNTALNQIKQHPYSFEISSAYPYLRKGKVTKFNTLIYQVEENEIIILQFIDARSNHPY